MASYFLRAALSIMEVRPNPHISLGFALCRRNLWADRRTALFLRFSVGLINGTASRRSGLGFSAPLATEESPQWVRALVRQHAADDLDTVVEPCVLPML